MPVVLQDGMRRPRSPRGRSGGRRLGLCRYRPAPALGVTLPCDTRCDALRRSPGRARGVGHSGVHDLLPDPGRASARVPPGCRRCGRTAPRAGDLGETRRTRWPRGGPRLGESAAPAAMERWGSPGTHERGDHCTPCRDTPRALLHEPERFDEARRPHATRDPVRPTACD